MTSLDVEISGEGQPLVLLHSLLQDRSSFSGLAKRLSAQRKIYNFNMPGFGASPMAEPLAGYANDLAAAFDELGLGPDTDVCGNGLGGFVGLNLAVHHGHRFNRLVLIGSAIRFPDPGRATFRIMADKAENEGMAVLADQALKRMFPDPYLDANREYVADLKKNFLSINPQVFAAACRALAGLDLGRDLARIKNSTLIVVGEQDSATAAPLGHELAVALNRGTIIVLENSGHAPHMQMPDAFVAAISPFLQLQA